MTIVEKIVMAAERRGLSQARIERLSGLPAGRISKWSASTGEPTGSQCWRLAETLGVPLDWLLNANADGPPPGSNDDQLVLRVFHALGMTADEAIQGLHHAAKARDLPAGSRGERDDSPPPAPKRRHGT